MKNNKRYKLSINVKLLTIIFVGILLLALILTEVSFIFINSSFDALYKEKLSIPSRTLLSQYSYASILPYVETLRNKENFTEDAKRFLADREYIAAMEKSRPDGDDLAEYEAAQRRITAYCEELSALKDDKYYSITKSLIEARISTGVKTLYIIADLGLEDGYVYVYNTFYQGDRGVLFNDDLGTVEAKTNHSELAQVYKTGEPVYVTNSDKKGGLSYSYTPIKDGYGNIVAVIGADINLELIGRQLKQFLLSIVTITAMITTIIILVVFFILQKTIVRPVKSLTDISREIANGNIYIDIPREILARKDEMGVLGNSYESMRTALEALISDNKTLFEAIIMGNLAARGDPSRFDGFFAQLINSTNNTLDVIGFYFDSIPAAVIILDSEYDIAYANDNFKQTFSRFSTAYILQKLLEKTDEEDADLKEELSAILAGGEYNCLQWFDIGGENRCYSFICNSIAHDEGKNGALIVILDNTELVLVKDRALSANKAKSEFLSRISHELRTPLNAILSLAKLGLNDKELRESTKRFEKIVSSSAHLSNIINDVLEMSRMESGKTEIRYAPMDVAELIEECVSMLALRAQENHNELVSSVDLCVPRRLLGDEFRIKQIIINLVSNALKFTENGKVAIDVVCAEKTDDFFLLNFSVTDTGIGMSEEFLGKIFTPFEQEDSFLSRRYEGSGLGLSISYNLVGLMGGFMEVRSKLGEGSHFDFAVKFATVPEDTAQSEEGGGPEAEEISLEGKRLLLVEDVEINRRIVAELLSESGVEIEEAVDGEEAVEKFANSPLYYYDCILMDVQMPKMDGYKATRAIRQISREDNGVPIIAMTANALKEDVDQALASGMNSHLSKPIDFELCINTIKQYCNKKRGVYL
ncbi:MAG: response regulator [Peptococcaceae bacterium]|jgi:signal transduction histidine kinase/ActR/RegA family two-component response regulator|nr:response regulator [Peptococcaceae bacterium]